MCCRSRARSSIPPMSEVKLPRLQASLARRQRQAAVRLGLRRRPADDPARRDHSLQDRDPQPAGRGDEDRRRFRGGSLGAGRRALSPAVMVGEGRPSTSLPAEGWVYPNGCKRSKKLTRRTRRNSGGHGGERWLMLRFSLLRVPPLKLRALRVKLLAVAPTRFCRRRSAAYRAGKLVDGRPSPTMTIERGSRQTVD